RGEVQPACPHRRGPGQQCGLRRLERVLQPEGSQPLNLLENANGRRFNAAPVFVCMMWTGIYSDSGGSSSPLEPSSEDGSEAKMSSSSENASSSRCGFTRRGRRAASTCECSQNGQTFHGRSSSSPQFWQVFLSLVWQYGHSRHRSSVGWLHPGQTFRFSISCRSASSSSARAYCSASVSRGRRIR